MVLNRRTRGAMGPDLLLTTAGGCMDAYSYLARGQVFATGQTGNFVLLAVHLARGDMSGVLHYLTPILLFWLGIFSAMHLRRRIFRGQPARWQRMTLLAETGCFLLIGALPGSVPDSLVNALISFCAAMQYSCFRTTGGGAYASIFCTGNMRSCAEQLYLGVVERDRHALSMGFRYLRVLGAFFVGVLLGVLFDRLFSLRSAWLICVLLLCAVPAIPAEPVEQRSAK